MMRFMVMAAPLTALVFLLVDHVEGIEQGCCSGVGAPHGDDEEHKVQGAMLCDVSNLIANELDAAARQNAHEERQVLTDSAHVSHKTIYGDYGRDSGEERE